jgi:hypothetical protein
VALHGELKALIFNSTTAVAAGDLSRKINVEAFGEILELKVGR